MALVHPGERRAALPRCDGSSSVFNYRGGWDVWLSCDDSLDGRQRAERRRLRGSDLWPLGCMKRCWRWMKGQTFGFVQRFVITSVSVLSVCYGFKFWFKWAVSPNTVLVSADLHVDLGISCVVLRLKKSTYVQTAETVLLLHWENGSLMTLMRGFFFSRMIFGVFLTFLDRGRRTV